MSDTVKTIIEIPKDIYERCKEYKLWSYDAETLEGAVATSKPLSENKGEWIPVSERLPEIHQYVLLSLRSLDVEVGFRAETEPYFYCHGADGCYIEPQNVLAWQPLPEPYKAEREE